MNVSCLYTGNEGPPVIHYTGELAYSGLPAKVMTTTRQTCPGPDGMREHTSTKAIEIVDFFESPLDPALFEVPEYFRERSVFPGFWDNVRSRIERALRRVRRS